MNNILQKNQFLWNSVYQLRPRYILTIVQSRVLSENITDYQYFQRVAILLNSKCLNIIILTVLLINFTYQNLHFPLFPFWSCWPGGGDKKLNASFSPLWGWPLVISLFVRLPVFSSVRLPVRDRLSRVHLLSPLPNLAHTSPIEYIWVKGVQCS